MLLVYSPLFDNTQVELMCTKISDTVQGRPASDVGCFQDCYVFLDFPVLVAMAEVPTKRITFKCTRPIEDRRPRRDALAVLMMKSASGQVHLPVIIRA